MAADLKPCPCCDGKARMSVQKGKSVIGTPWHREYIACACGVMTKIFKTPGKAVKVWNRRSAMEAN